jgi:hypothetical protein
LIVADRSTSLIKDFTGRAMVRAARDIKDFNYHEALFPSIFVTENRTVLRCVTSPLSQFSITLLEIEDQCAFQVLQVVDFASNFGEFGAQQVLDFPASMSTTVSQIEKLLDFLQGEPESLHLLDKSESCYVLSGIDPEVPRGSGCSWQQRPALVEADRIYAEFRLLCGFTNLDYASGPLQRVWHKKNHTLWTVLQSQVRICNLRRNVASPQA